MIIHQTVIGILHRTFPFICNSIDGEDSLSWPSLSSTTIEIIACHSWRGLFLLLMRETCATNTLVWRLVCRTETSLRSCGNSRKKSGSVVCHSFHANSSVDQRPWRTANYSLHNHFNGFPIITSDNTFKSFFLFCLLTTSNRREHDYSTSTRDLLLCEQDGAESVGSCWSLGCSSIYSLGERHRKGLSSRDNDRPDSHPFLLTIVGCILAVAHAQITSFTFQIYPLFIGDSKTMTSILTVLKYLMIMTRKFFFVYGRWSSFDVPNSASQLSDASNSERLRHEQYRSVSWLDRQPSSFSTSIAALPSACGLQKSKSQTSSWPIPRLGIWEKRSVLEDLSFHVAVLDFALKKTPTFIRWMIDEINILDRYALLFRADIEDLPKREHRLSPRIISPSGQHHLFEQHNLQAGFHPSITLDSLNAQIRPDALMRVEDDCACGKTDPLTNNLSMKAMIVVPSREPHSSLLAVPASMSKQIQDHESSWNWIGLLSLSNGKAENYSEIFNESSSLRQSKFTRQRQVDKVQDAQ